ncbi:MAG: glycosyltransferase, partial [Candidatus Eisenbacteria bacterium]|nr:glycosyltransferase [Candidatus Eisenbacteria bacterium]
IPDEAQVFRSGITEFYDVYRRLTGKSKDVSLDIQTVQRADTSWKDALARMVRGSVFIPDGRVGWYRPGVALGKRILRELDPAAIFATGPPFTAHWIGRTLSSVSGKPLVLDFRDPWTRATFYPERPGWAKRLDEKLEASCVRQASVCVSVGRELRDDLIERVGGTTGDWEILLNGFDPADFEGVDPEPRRHPSIAHVGSVFAQRIPWTFLDVFARWTEALPERRQARLVFAGRLAPEMELRVAKPDLQPNVDLLGFLSHRESLALMRSVDLLLLLTSEDATSRGMLTGKVFEYLGSGTPILALAPEGEAEELLDASQGGATVRPSDAEGIGNALDAWWISVQQHGRAPWKAATTGTDRLQFSRRVQAERLASILDRVTETSP